MSNLQFEEWEALIHNTEDATIVNCLKFGFLVGYEGLILTPTVANNSLAIHHPRDVAVYTTKEVSEGAMLRPYEAPPP